MTKFTADKLKSFEQGPVGHLMANRAREVKAHGRSLHDEHASHAGHAFSRHGHQSGWQAQVIRAATGLTPDQSFDPLGLVAETRVWNLTGEIGDIFRVFPAGSGFYTPTWNAPQLTNGQDSGGFFTPELQQRALIAVRNAVGVQFGNVAAFEVQATTADVAAQATLFYAALEAAVVAEAKERVKPSVPAKTPLADALQQWAGRAAYAAIAAQAAADAAADPAVTGAPNPGAKLGAVVGVAKQKLGAQKAVLVNAFQTGVDVKRTAWRPIHRVAVMLPDLPGGYGLGFGSAVPATDATKPDTTWRPKTRGHVLAAIDAYERGLTLGDLRRVLANDPEAVQLVGAVGERDYAALWQALATRGVHREVATIEPATSSRARALRALHGAAITRSFQLAVAPVAVTAVTAKRPDDAAPRKIHDTVAIASWDELMHHLQLRSWVQSRVLAIFERRPGAAPAQYRLVTLFPFSNPPGGGGKATAVEYAPADRGAANGPGGWTGALSSQAVAPNGPPPVATRRVHPPAWAGLL